MSFWLTAFSAALGAFLSGVVVKFLDHLIWNSKGVERHRDDDLAEIEATALKIRDLAIQYWSQADSEGSMTADGAAISGRLFFLGQLAERVFVSSPRLLREMNVVINDLHKAVTNGCFDVKNRDAEPQRARAIESCTYSVIDKSNVCRRKLPSKFMRF